MTSDTSFKIWASVDEAPKCELCDKKAVMSDYVHALCVDHWPKYVKDEYLLFGTEELE
jgi:hypothetical protein